MPWQNQGLTVPDRNICWYTTQELDDFRQSRDISFLKKFLERITPDCTAFICEDDFIAWLLWEELSLGQEKKIATHAPFHPLFKTLDSQLLPPAIVSKPQ